MSGGRSESLGDLVDRSGRGANSLDAVRLAAALLVLVSHAFVLTTGREEHEPLFSLSNGQLSLGYVAVGIFFVLSGFLITRSYALAESTVSYAWKRCLRIVPGLWASLIVTIAFAGVLLSSFSLANFVWNKETLTFLGNGLFLPVHQSLPGVFADHPFPHAVNGSLWTLKYEVLCYVLVVLFGSMRNFQLLLVTAAWLLSVAVSNIVGYKSLGGVVYHVVILADLFQYFGAGMLLYLLRNSVPVSYSLCALLLLIWSVLIFSPVARTSTALLLSYPILCLGLTKSHIAQAVVSRGDLSYGVYVYAFPIQQTFVSISLTTAWPSAANIALSLPVTFLVALLSWRFIERPSLRARGWLRQQTLAF